MGRGKDATVVDAITKTMRCEVCKEEVPIPLGKIDWTSSVMQAFVVAHRGCDGRKGKTGFSVPKTF